MGQWELSQRVDLFRSILLAGIEGGGGLRFLSVFKWEKRKGWDILLRAYFEARGENSRMWGMRDLL